MKVPSEAKDLGHHGDLVVLEGLDVRIYAAACSCCNKKSHGTVEVSMAALVEGLGLYNAFFVSASAIKHGSGRKLMR